MRRNKRRNTNKQTKQFLGIIIIIVFLAIGVIFGEDVLDITKLSNSTKETNLTVSTSQDKRDFNIDNIPEYEGEIYIEINNNMPYFEESE